jgi:hypothetical protein
MRVTRDILLKLASENAAKLVEKDRSIHCVYITGSLLREDPFLGGVTDIDLICIHDRPVKVEREIIRINADVHVDVAHLPQSLFDHPRNLRSDAWLGGSLAEGPKVLHDLSRWFDYTRASATAQFWNTDQVAARARSFSARSRQAWQQLSDESIPQGIKRAQAYIDALEDLANSVNALSGKPLTTRRLVYELPERAARVDFSDFTGAFVNLFTTSSFNEEHWASWLKQWQEGLLALKEIKEAPIHLGISRHNYYLKAATALAAERPATALWIMLHTWTQAAAFLPKGEQPYKEWQNFAHALDLDGRGLMNRLTDLDALIDNVDTFLDRWQEANV